MLYFLRYFSSYVVTALLFNFLSIAQEKIVVDIENEINVATNYLFNLRCTGESAKVNSEIILNKDVGMFRLQNGTIYTCINYQDTPYALIFIGEGKFSFTPSTDIEKKQLYRFFETESIDADFSSLFLLFDDNTYDEIFSNLTFERIDPKPANNEIKDCKDYLMDGDVGYSRSDFLRSMMKESRNGFFYSQIEGSKFGTIFFQINPFESEEIYFMRSGERSAWIGSDKRHEIINQFPAQRKTLENYSGSKPNKYFLDLISYNIESTIADNLDFSASCTIDFKSLESNQHWIMFYLYEDLYVDSVKWENGMVAEFVNLDENSELWIKCINDYLDANQHNMKIYYHGDLLEKNELGWIELKSSIFWYPRYDNREKSVFNLTFNTPSKYQLVSIGDLAERIDEGDVISSIWRCSTPTRNASFNVGNFEVNEIENENLPTVSVYTSEYGHQIISSYFRQIGILSMSDASEYIAQDVSNSVTLFTNLYGNLSLNSIRATEIPYFHGEAFPGLIHLSWLTVIQTNFKGEDEVFRAHEVAHQWWGIGVDFDTYHDQWLSEGFAEYSGLWYLQAAKKDNELFFEILGEWKDEILNVRKYIFGSGQEAGPAWLGYRTSSSNTKGDYDLIVYKKGAWILHMLRAMLLDLNTMNEDKMKNLLHEYYETYKNKSASTEDFKRIVDKHFGEDMSWFFNQYVYGTDIPTYTVAYKTEETEDAKIKISIRVRQEEVSESFKMYVPVKLVFDGDRVGRFRIEVKGKETIKTFQLPDGELEELIFNDLESVLCELEYEDWD